MNWVLVLSMFSATLMASACGGGSTGETVKTTNRSSAVSTQADANSAGAAALENSAAPANGASENPLVASRNKKLEAMRAAGNVQPMPPADIEAILDQSTRPAPENSEFSVALTDILVERRTFKQHEILAKVEKVTEGSKKTIYVFTKDGTKRELPGDAIESISTAQSAAILRAIGIEPKRASPSAAKPNAAVKN